MRPCDDCHDTRAFAPSTYDHNETTQSNFPLVGKHEGGGMMKHGARAIRDIFRRSDHPRWRYREFANTRHDEASWAKQLPLVLPELYPA